MLKTGVRKATMEKKPMSQPAEPGQDDRSVARRWLAKSLVGSVVLATLLFVSAGTVRWPMAWLLFVLFVAVAIATYLLVDPALIAERSLNRRSTQKWDNVLMGVYGTLTVLVVPVVAGLDFRFDWSPKLPVLVEIVALVVNIAGWSLHIWAMRANAFFAIVVRLQEDRNQTVASGGPYQWIRHPGYAGGICFNLATPIMLGSLWGLIPAMIAALLLVLRTALEDRLLHRKLAGYVQYAATVRYRLVPGVW